MGSLTKITTNSIKDGEVKTAEINDSAVTTAKLAANAVTTGKINDGTITGSDLSSTLDLSSKTLTLADSSFNNQHFNVALLGFKMAVNDSLTVFNLVDGVVDEFHDESGTDEGEGSNDTYCASNDRYTNQLAVCSAAAFTLTTVTEPDTSTAGTNPGNGVGTSAVYTVPTGLTSVNIQVWGAGGGGGSEGTGGGGGYAEGTLAVTAGQSLHVISGEGGRGNAAAPEEVGGFFGGGHSDGTPTGSAHGGGLAGVFSVASGSLNAVPHSYVVAGAGGGGADNNGRDSTHPDYVATGGAGGGLIGDAGSTITEQNSGAGPKPQSGISPSGSAGQLGGGGGSQTAGGASNEAPAYGPAMPNASGLYKGGPASSQAPMMQLGAGGSGFYGGGGGRADPDNGGVSGSGGGGSSYFGHPQITSGSTEEGRLDEGGGITQPGYQVSELPDGDGATNEGGSAPNGDAEDGYVIILGSGNVSQSTTIVSNAFTASSAPNKSRIVVFQEDVTSTTLNTDIIASVSRNGGSNFSTVTLVDEGYVTGASGQRVLAGLVDISGQPSGTSMRWKIALANNQSRIHGVSLSWA